MSWGDSLYSNRWQKNPIISLHVLWTIRVGHNWYHRNSSTITSRSGGLSPTMNASSYKATQVVGPMGYPIKKARQLKSDCLWDVILLPNLCQVLTQDRLDHMGNIHYNHWSPLKNLWRMQKRQRRKVKEGRRRPTTSIIMALTAATPSSNKGFRFSLFSYSR